MKATKGKVNTRVRLLRRYGRFFTCLGYLWECQPQGRCFRMDGRGSGSVIKKSDRFDFRIVQPCHNSECGGSHILLVKIDPKATEKKLATTSLAFWDFLKLGRNPMISIGQWTHGHGGGIYKLTDELSESEIRKAWRSTAR